MRTWLADQEAFCPWCESWVVPAAAWAIDPAVIVRDDDSLNAIMSGELRTVAYKIPENERRWDVEHYPDVYSKHHFVGTLRPCGTPS